MHRAYAGHPWAQRNGGNWWHPKPPTSLQTSDLRGTDMGANDITLNHMPMGGRCWLLRAALHMGPCARRHALG